MIPEDILPRYIRILSPGAGPTSSEALAAIDERFDGMFRRQKYVLTTERALKDRRMTTQVRAVLETALQFVKDGTDPDRAEELALSIHNTTLDELKEALA